MAAAHDKPHSDASGAAATAPRARRRLSRVQWGVLLTAVVLVSGGGVWWITRPAAEQGGNRLAEALQLLEAHEVDAARELAKQLEEEHFEDADFPGGVEYVLGMAALQEADAAAAEEQRQQYSAAASYLREAEHRGLPDAHRPSWTAAFGRVQFHLDQLAAAQPLLEEAVASQPAELPRLAGLLTELYLDPSHASPELLVRALELNDRVLALKDRGAAEQSATLQQRVEILLALNKVADASAALARLPNEHAADDSVVILRARVLIAEHQYAAALQVLPRAVRDDAPVEAPLRQAHYLMGYAAELLSRQKSASAQGAGATAADLAEAADYRQRAIEYFQKTVNRFEQSPEGLVALLHLGRLHQEDGGHEKALQAFGAALRMVREPAALRNRWIGVEEFRQRIQAAWTMWSNSERLPEAIALAELMTPLFAKDQAYELSARAHQRAAENLEEELAQATATVRKQRQDELRRKWRESGAAYARLAAARQHAPNYAEPLWTSADHFRRGQELTTALQQTQEFLTKADARMRPVALVRRGQLLLDLDRTDEALQDLQQVIKESPTSPSAFSAQYLLGVTRLERDEPAAAEAAWRSILDSQQLTPAATEWRDALLALGRLLYDTAALERRKIDSRAEDGVPADVRWARVVQRNGEAVRLLEQYVTRYAQSPQLPEVRYHLAKALQLQAETLKREWDAAETDNARQQARRHYEQTLDRALGHIRLLIADLTAGAKADRLDDLQRELLASSWFELPHTLFALGRAEEAIAAYSAAANRFPQDVRVLTAYVQMAQAYAQLGRSVEARSMLEQAKVILNQQQIPAPSFDAPTTSLTRAEWDAWLERARQVQH